MKRLIAIFVFCFTLTTVFAQEAVEFKNAGNEALKAKDFAKALENYEKAIAAWGDQPQDFPMIYNTGVCAFKLKDYAKSIKYFDQAIAGAYKVETAYLYKAMSYKAENNTEAYLSTLNEGITKSAENTQLKGELAKYNLMEGNTHYKNGVTIKNAAIAKIPSKFKDVNDPGYKAEIEKAKKEFNAALPFLNKAVELNPADENAKKLKATCESEVK